MRRSGGSAAEEHGAESGSPATEVDDRRRPGAPGGALGDAALRGEELESLQGGHGLEVGVWVVLILAFYIGS